MQLTLFRENPVQEVSESVLRANKYEDVPKIAPAVRVVFPPLPRVVFLAPFSRPPQGG